MAKKLAIIFGAVFLLISALDFFPNPIVGGDAALFEVNRVHTAIHIATGLVLLFAGLRSAAAAKAGLIALGIIYLAFEILGFMQIGTTGEGSILGIVHMNANDNFLHAAFALIFIIAGFATQKDPSAPTGTAGLSA